ncbi:hypothetical protein FACS18949_11360 [Clostridia bacterium]|nr:hypothetical protein FACS18949_11360 [Clostridia bacterium]
MYKRFVSIAVVFALLCALCGAAEPRASFSAMRSGFAEKALASLDFKSLAVNGDYLSVIRGFGIDDGNPANILRETARRAGADSLRLHGFYAFSSYNQRYVTDSMEAVSLGWSSMLSDGTLDTSSGEWKIPSSPESIISYLKANGTRIHLGVYMGAGVSSLLSNAGARAKAVASIMAAELYDGVTIDFEGLKSPSRDNFTAFITELSKQLKVKKKTLYVAVQPATADGVYYDGFDYERLGELTDKVILMAHDYNAVNLNGYEGTERYKTTALTPLSPVYYSLKAVSDAIADKRKIALAISFATLGWEIKDGLLVSGTPYHPAIETVAARIAQADTIQGWSETYHNPYITYKTEDGKTIFLWYEDARSVNDKIRLAKMFGINSVSLWRIGNIPDSANYSVWESLK